VASAGLGKGSFRGAVFEPARSGLGRTYPFQGEGTKVWSWRYLVARAGPGERPEAPKAAARCAGARRFTLPQCVDVGGHAELARIRGWVSCRRNADRAQHRPQVPRSARSFTRTLPAARKRGRVVISAGPPPPRRGEGLCAARPRPGPGLFRGLRRRRPRCPRRSRGFRVQEANGVAKANQPCGGQYAAPRRADRSARRAGCRAGQRRGRPAPRPGEAQQHSLFQGLQVLLGGNVAAGRPLARPPVCDEENGALLRRGADRAFSQNVGGGVGDWGAFEEVGILRAKEAHRVGEGEVAEIVAGDQLVLDQFPGLR
jgi:hypothetical protein